MKGYKLGTITQDLKHTKWPQKVSSGEKIGITHVSPRRQQFLHAKQGRGRLELGGMFPIAKIKSFSDNSLDLATIVFFFFLNTVKNIY